MAACLAFVFLGLLEFAYVNVQSRVLSRRMSFYRRQSVAKLQNGVSHLNGNTRNGDAVFPVLVSKLLYISLVDTLYSNICNFVSSVLINVCH